jgi:hypothetical protein
MAQSKKLAESLEQLQELQKKGVVAIRSRDLTRTHLNRVIIVDHSRCIRDSFDAFRGWT